MLEQHCTNIDVCRTQQSGKGVGAVTDLLLTSAHDLCLLLEPLYLTPTHPYILHTPYARMRMS